MIYSLKINIDKYLEEITLDTKKNKIDFSKFFRFLYDVHLPWKRGRLYVEMVNFGSAFFLPLLVVFQCFTSLLN